MKDATRSELRKALLFAAGVLALVLVALAYRPAAGGAFIWDDHVLVERDAEFRHVPLRSLFTTSFWPASPLTDVNPSYYRPVVLLSFRVDLALGDDARSFHVTNILLHLTAAILLAVVAVRAGASVAASVLAALLWAIAPRLSESVAWISGRTDVLACLFGMGALAFTPSLGAAPPRIARSLATAVCLFLALASKEVAIAFAIALLAAHARRRSLRAWLPRTGIEVGAPLVLWLLLRSVALTRRVQPLRDLGPVGRIGTVLEGTERYVEMTFDALHPRTSIGMLGRLDSTRVAFGAVLVVGLLALLVVAVRRGHVGARVGALVSAVSLGLVIHIVPLSLSSAVTADRMLYVPLAGLAVALACAARPLSATGGKRLGAVAIALALFLVHATHARAGDYRDEGTFWLVATENAHPENPAPLRALAAHVESAADTTLACRLHERARDLVARSAPVASSTTRLTHETLAACWIRLGRYENARSILEEQARLHPTHGRLWMSVGFARVHTLDFDGAAEAFATALTLDGALAPSLEVAMKSLPRTRANAARFADPAARAAAPDRYAGYLADIGHLPEAELAYYALTLDPEQTKEVHSAAAAFVIMHGPLAHANELAARETFPYGSLLSLRRDRNMALQPLVPRIERLLAER